MAWNKQLEAQIVGAKGPVRGLVRVAEKTKKSTLVIVLSDDMTQTLGNPKAANAWLGEEEDTGRVLVQFDESGDLPVREFGLGGARLHVKLPPALDAETRTLVNLQYETAETEEGVKQLIVTLPSSWLAG